MQANLWALIKKQITLKNANYTLLQARRLLFHFSSTYFQSDCTSLPLIFLSDATSSRHSLQPQLVTSGPACDATDETNALRQGLHHFSLKGNTEAKKGYKVYKVVVPHQLTKY
jgi:hypothetical protein